MAAARSSPGAFPTTGACARRPSVTGPRCDLPPAACPGSVPAAAGVFAGLGWRSVELLNQKAKSLFEKPCFKIRPSFL